MLLIHQTGSVKIGEVVRYTITYTPSQDRILPSPQRLHVRLRNTSTIAMRAAFVHGPYTLYVAAYPTCFNPNERFSSPRRYGMPEFEPTVKAGGSWQCELVVPDDIRETAGAGVATRGVFGGVQSPDGRAEANREIAGDEQPPPPPPPTSASWIVEIASQVVFSTSATVGYELMVARDEKSLTVGSQVPIVGGHVRVPEPGKLAGFQQSHAAKDGRQPASPKGVFSKALTLKIEDTAMLWNTPQLPGWDRVEDTGLHAKPKEARPAEAEAGLGAESVIDKTPSQAAAPTQKNSKPGEKSAPQSPRSPPRRSDQKKQDKKKVHLVLLTHGIHSNLGADMLYIKESIDAAAKQAKIDAKARRARERADVRANVRANTVNNSNGEGKEVEKEKNKAENENGNENEDEDEDEDVIVRGFPGNAARTDKGIKFLGKRLARHVLVMTYPDQPFLPIPTSSYSHKSAAGVKPVRAHKGSTIHEPHGAHDAGSRDRPYQITSISFVGHSLGGLVQMYAIAYIQKHSPTFFDSIRPINFVALASPFLGLSNENPIYVKFALDFGIVGRTGQDLGLTWRPPTIARNGWGALMASMTESTQKERKTDDKETGKKEDEDKDKDKDKDKDMRPDSKPLLRILPTGPAHVALRRFRNRTVYSNVVNDGIVPLRTSCLLFLDWQGLGKAEKARREAGLVETVVSFGWAELTGANTSSSRRGRLPLVDYDDEPPPSGVTSGSASPLAHAHEVPQPSKNATAEDDRQSLQATAAVAAAAAAAAATTTTTTASSSSSDHGLVSPFAGFFSLFRGSGSNSDNEPHKPPAHSEKTKKIIKRSQTLHAKREESASPPEEGGGSGGGGGGGGSEIKAGKSKAAADLDADNHPEAPPRTTFLESARDLLNPRIPPPEFLIDPSKRPRSIFHDRVYHPWDIPPPPVKKRSISSSGLGKKRSSSRSRVSSSLSAVSAASAASAASTIPTGGGAATSSPHPAPRAPPVHQDSMFSIKDYDDTANTGPEKMPDQVVDSSGMRIEEKIARAYHRDMSWRKVLVKVEPDAHNNIMVRRMFTNAYGWPIVKHLVDNHFSDSAAARTRDDDEGGLEQALDPGQRPDEHGRETRGSPIKEAVIDDGGSTSTSTEDRLPSTPRKRHAPSGVPSILTPSLTEEPEDLWRTESEVREAEDSVSPLPGSKDERSHSQKRLESAMWSDTDPADSEVDSGQTTPDENVSGPPNESSTAAAGSESTEGPTSLSTGWGWAEKIVGRGAMENLRLGRRSRSASRSVSRSQSRPSSKSKSKSRSRSPTTLPPPVATTATTGATTPATITTAATATTSQEQGDAEQPK